MKKCMLILICAALALASACAYGAESETQIQFSEDQILVNGAPISESADEAVYLLRQIETHEDVPQDLKDLANRVVTIADAGVYRVRGEASDVQLAVRAGDQQRVRIILDGVSLSCRTAPAIVVYSALDPRTAGEYGAIIELAANSENNITASHTRKTESSNVKLSGAISSLVSIGFEGEGSLNVDADEEGIEAKFGHITFNGGTYHILAADDPINVSEDEIGVLTVNDGYLFSQVKPDQGGEGDGVDSNGFIEFNGGVIINLAHPNSADSGIDSDMGSRINGGVVVGAGNMYDPIDAASEQLFMMLEFTQPTEDLVVVTNANDEPVFAYDFPNRYTYIAFSTPDLAEGSYHVYLGGEIEGAETDGLYTSIASYKLGTPMQHGGARQRQAPQMDGGNPPELPEMHERPNPPEKPEGMPKPDAKPDGEFSKQGGGLVGPRGMQSSAEIATREFALSSESTEFSGIAPLE